jgi:hypothetical protein
MLQCLMCDSVIMGITKQTVIILYVTRVGLFDTKKQILMFKIEFKDFEMLE